MIIKLESVKKKEAIINIEALSRPGRQLSAELISAATENVHRELAEEHSADPIKSLDDIDRISSYLIENRRYRDNMLFIVGINFGLRISDLRVLIFSDIINDDFSFRDSFPVFERKTRNTRKKKTNRYITVNDAVIEAVTLYLRNTPGVSLSDYMFRSESNRGKNDNKPMTLQGVYTMLKGVEKDLCINASMSTHTLRKTFGYHQMMMSGNSPRKLLLLQKMFGHSSSMQTLEYIGLTDEEIAEAYQGLNLGSRNHYITGVDIFEREEAM